MFIIRSIGYYKFIHRSLWGFPLQVVMDMTPSEEEVDIDIDVINSSPWHLPDLIGMNGEEK